MIEKFDLTKSKGLQAVNDFLGKSIMPRILPDFSLPYLDLGKFALEKIFSTNSVEKEKELVAALIKEGKDKGVDEMEIDVNNRRGFDFNIPIEGIDIKTMVGANEKMRIKVKYK